jgi:FtsP/CotA-like multicopper oxidase with cupredoxin domain
MELWSRRRLLATAAAATLGVAGGGCGIASRSRPVGPAAREVAATEARRRRPGAPVREATLTAAATTIDLAGRAVTAWAYNHTVPGPLLRVRVGEVLRVRLDNRLPEPTSIHWHGVVVRNDMDGVPGVTQPPVPANGGFVYEFAVPDAGTYFFHPHVGLQLDRGLYAALVVDDPAEPGGYDQEAVVVLDDWTLGVGPTPEQLQDQLMAQGGMMRGGMGMMGQGGGSAALGGSGGQIAYPRYLLNGHPPADPPTIRAKPGQRLRLRVINAAAETAFRVALGGHRLTVTHTDGLPVAPPPPRRCCLAWASAPTRWCACRTAPSRWWRWPRASPARPSGWSVPAGVRRRLPTPIPVSWVGGWRPWPSSAPTSASRCRTGGPTAATSCCCRAG